MRNQINFFIGLAFIAFSYGSYANCTANIDLEKGATGADLLGAIQCIEDRSNTQFEELKKLIIQQSKNSQNKEQLSEPTESISANPTCSTELSIEQGNLQVTLTKLTVLGEKTVITSFVVKNISEEPIPLVRNGFGYMYTSITNKEGKTKTEKNSTSYELKGGEERVVSSRFEFDEKLNSHEFVVELKSEAAHASAPFFGVTPQCF